MRPGFYLKLLGVQLKLSALLSLQYRVDFVSDGLTSGLWLFFNVLPLWAAFGHRTTIAGWTYPEALIVLGLFTLLKGIMDGAINPSLSAVVEQVRKGTLDFSLLKPADAQFLVSTARVQPWKMMDVVGGAALCGYAFVKLGHGPTPGELGAGGLLLLASLTILYSLWILTVCAAFFVVRLDNLVYLFSSVFDLARWPASIFRGFYRVIFTFVIPLAIMTTYPALALLGKLSVPIVAWTVGGTLLFATLSRRLWVRAIRHYSSASS